MLLQSLLLRQGLLLLGLQFRFLGFQVLDSLLQLLLGLQESLVLRVCLHSLLDHFQQLPGGSETGVCEVQAQLQLLQTRFNLTQAALQLPQARLQLLQALFHLG